VATARTRAIWFYSIQRRAASLLTLISGVGVTNRLNHSITESG
jgi:hypothetical protein